jgi:hypothetical protein
MWYSFIKGLFLCKTSRFVLATNAFGQDLTIIVRAQPSGHARTWPTTYRIGHAGRLARAPTAPGRRRSPLQSYRVPRASRRPVRSRLDKILSKVKQAAYLHEPQLHHSNDTTGSQVTSVHTCVLALPAGDAHIIC